MVMLLTKSGLEMTQREQFDSSPIKPIYLQTAPNEPIEYGTAVIETVGKGGNGNLQAQATFREKFSHDHRHEFTVLEHTKSSDDVDGMRQFIRMMSQAPNKIMEGKGRFRFVDHGTTFSAFCVHATSDRLVYRPAQTPMQVRPSSDSISKAIFHLFNWPDVSGPEGFVLQTGEPPYSRLRACVRFRLECEGWSITVAEFEETDGLIKMLKETGGYAITHVGQIQRTDGQIFSSKDLEQTLACLGYFFSLVLGRWSQPSLTVGFDDVDQRVFEHWGFQQTTIGSYAGGNSFFDSRHDEIFNALFPGFWQRWHDPLWNSALSESIYWYIGANNLGFGVNVDSALLFTQSALELLAWTYCVQDRKAVSEIAFGPRGLSAADKLTLLTSLLGISNQIPAQLKSLHAKRGKPWSDSMHAITDLRNGLVHPKDRAVLPDGVYYDAWRLSLWYLDLIFLRLLGYEGQYSNRMTTRFVGAVEDVPWK